MDKMWILKLEFWFYCAAFIASTQVIATSVLLDNTDCVLDHDGTNAALDACLEKGQTFVRDYLRHMSRNKLQEFNTCNDYKGFGHCIQDLWRRCPTIQQVTHKHWKPVVDLMTCSCNNTIEKHECQHARQCLEAEFTGVLVKRCDELYDFNLQQGTRDKCVFLKETILCRTALVTSACGKEVGEAAYALSKISQRRTIEKTRCYITLEDAYDGFRYSDACPRDIKDEVHECYATHLEQYSGRFTVDNNLVVDGKLKTLKDMCSAWREYKQCTRGVREDCNEGVQLVYEQNGTLRSMLLKLDYICKEARQDYADNLYCLQEVLEQDALSTCKGHWSALEPWLRNTTSYQFYCQQHSKNTHATVNALESLRYCFEGVFAFHCNDVTASMMSELIRRAFDDPFYLRFAYRADCDLHKMPSSLKRSNLHAKQRHLRHQHRYGSRDGNNHDHVIEPKQPISDKSTLDNNAKLRDSYQSELQQHSSANSLTLSFLYIIIMSCTVTLYITGMNTPR